MRILSRLSAALVAAAAVSMVAAGAASAAPSAADPYSGGIATDCSISVPAHLEVGDKVRITFSVEANSPTPPDGTVDLAILDAGDVVWTKSVGYHGGTRTVLGPALDKGGDYRATARFSPSDNTFKRCQAGVNFAVAATNAPNPDDNDGSGGLLPDTGGPGLVWLLLGVCLLGGGAAAVVVARRRADEPVSV